MLKMLTVHHHGIEKKFHYDGFEINSERDIKSLFQVDYYFTDEKSKRNFGKLAIKYKLGFLFFTSKHRIFWCILVYKVIQDGKYIASYPSAAFPKPILN